MRVHCGKISVTVWRLSVCLYVDIYTVTHQRAAYDAASVNFGPTIRRTDIFVSILYHDLIDQIICN